MKTGVTEQPQRLLVRGFAVAILLGALLLMCPFSSATGQWTSPLTALFTATSATCVTGLSVVDIGTHYSLFGQGVILLLIQLGGLGIMTVSTFLLVLVGRGLSTQGEFVIMDSLGSKRVRGLRSLLWSTLGFTVFLEALGGLLLAWRVAERGEVGPSALYSGFFHAISAFCNAGFSLYPDNMARFAGDPVVLLTTGGLVVLGGLGFMVLHNLATFRFWKKDRVHRGRLSLHTRLVIGTSLLLVAGGWILITLAEWNHTLQDYPAGRRLLVGLYHSVVPRTAGFNVVDLGQVEPVTLFLTMVLMFIGGSPGSTAGGIKTTSLVVLLMVMRAMFRGKRDVEVANRSVSVQVTREALTIFLLSLLFISVVFGALLVTDVPLVPSGSQGASERLLFEIVSAFGTVGLSTGITGGLSDFGKLCIILVMFVGRLGPLTIALMVGRKDVRQVVQYPEEEVVIG